MSSFNSAPTNAPKNMNSPTTNHLDENKALSSPSKSFRNIAPPLHVHSARIIKTKHRAIEEANQQNLQQPSSKSVNFSPDVVEITNSQELLNGGANIKIYPRGSSTDGMTNEVDGADQCMN
jgi:hypothetical protein